MNTLTFLPSACLSLDQVANEPDIFLLQVDGVRLIAVALAAIHHVLKQSRRRPLMRPLSVRVYIPQKVVVKHVRERTVAEIVAQASDGHVEYILL